MSRPRRTPYTEIGIRRVPCFRCGRSPSYASWTICADGNGYRPMCKECDVALNELVLRWAGDPEVDRKMRAYRETVTCP